MGMYDYVKCEFPLTRPEMQDRLFQTKDTPNQFLDTYTITADGRLLGPKYDLEWQEDAEAPMGGYLKRENLQMHDADFSGRFVFYDFETGSHLDSDLIYFEAMFDRGKLLCIRELESDDEELLP